MLIKPARKYLRRSCCRSWLASDQAKAQGPSPASGLLRWIFSGRLNKKPGKPFAPSQTFSLQNLFSLPNGGDKVELRSKLREIGVFYWACIVFVPYFIAEQSFAYQTTRYFPVLIPLYAVLALAPVLYRRTANYRLYAGYIATFGIALVILLIAYEGGNRSPGAFWLMGVPLIFGLVNGSRGVLFGTGVMVATFIGFLLLNHWQMLPNLVAEHGDYEVEKLINLVGFGIYNVITSYYFIRTEEKAQKELRLQKQETENLLRILVHDVANPINAIQLATHAAKSGRRDSEAILSLVDGALDELAAIVQQVRKLRAVKDGKLEMALEPVSARTTLADAVRLLRQQAEHKGIQLDFDMAQEDAYVLADEPLLKNAIFANPISNAIKFSHPGQTVRIALATTASQVSVTIADEGVGMSEKIQRDIFDATAPTTRIGTGGERGTGYGMPLVKAYVAKLGGDIELVSSQQPDASGTTVTIRLPRCLGYAD